MERTRREDTNDRTIANLKRLKKIKSRLATVNLVPGQRVVDEELYPGKIELREWKPHTSKLAAAIKKGLVLEALGDKPSILYLGAASGTTVSYLSDLYPKGRIYAVELSRDPTIDLVLLAQTRPNIIPILADARRPEAYEKALPPIDLVFQDIAQRDQVEIFMRNCVYARARAPLLIAIKSRSIDVTASVSAVARLARSRLSERLIIEQELRLEPYEKDHVFFSCRWK
jgi:fibrillarin-like pre-rRNA processing protein